MKKRTIIWICLAAVGAAAFAGGMFAFFYTKANGIHVDSKAAWWLAMAGWLSLVVTRLLSRRKV